MKSALLDVYLKKLGFRENLTGTHMIRRAVPLWRPGCRITKDIYPEVAKQCGSTASRVERGIRHAIETSFDRADPDYLAEVFGGTIDPGRGKPCNAEFIAMMARACREEELDFGED